jgi:hypothetical protein
MLLPDLQSFPMLLPNLQSFPMLLPDLQLFLDLFPNRFSKVPIPGIGHNCFQANPRVCIEVDLGKKKLPLLISFMTLDGVQKQKFRYLNFPNVLFVY